MSRSETIQLAGLRISRRLHWGSMGWLWHRMRWRSMTQRIKGWSSRAWQWHVHAGWPTRWLEHHRRSTSQMKKWVWSDWAKNCKKSPWGPRRILKSHSTSCLWSRTSMQEVQQVWFQSTHTCQRSSDHCQKSVRVQWPESCKHKETKIDPLPTHELIQEENDYLPPPRPGIFLRKTHQVGAHAINFSNLKGCVVTGFCGRFPNMSSRGMNHTFTSCDYESNNVFAAPSQSWKGPVMAAACKKCHKQLTNTGLNPVLQHLNTKVSKELMASMKEKNFNCQPS